MVLKRCEGIAANRVGKRCRKTPIGKVFNMRGHCLQSGRQALHVRGHHRQSGRQALHKNFQSGCSFFGRPSIVITTPLRTRDFVLVSRDADFCVITWTHQPLDIHVRYAHLQSSARAIATHKHVRQTRRRTDGRGRQRASP